MIDHDDRPRGSLRTVLVWPFLLLILITGALVAGLSLFNFRKAIDTVSAELRAEMTAAIGLRLENFLSIPQQINLVNANAIRDGEINPQSIDAMTTHFRHQIEVFKTVSSIYYGNVEGGLLAGGRDGAQDDYYIIKTDHLVSGRFSKIQVDAAGRALRTLFSRPDFDARTRPWYQTAVAKGGGAWSEIYILSTGDGMAIASTRSVYDHQNALLGVVAADLSLSQISDFLQQLNRDRPGQTFIMEDSGFLVGSSIATPLFTVNDGRQPERRLHARDSANTLIAGVGRFIDRQGIRLSNLGQQSHYSLEVRDEQYFLELAPFKDSFGLSWVIAIATPQSSWMVDINAGNRQTLWLIALALAVTGVVGFMVARGIAHPILRLNLAAKRLAAGDLGSRITLRRDDEVGQLAETFNQMADRLQQAMVGQRQQIAELVAREQALRESEQRLNAMFQSTQIAMLLIGPDSRIRDANATASRVFGYSIPALCALPVEALIPEATGAGHGSLCDALLDPTSADSHEVRELIGRRQNGEEFAIEIGLAAVQLGSIPHIIASVSDVSERQRARLHIQNLVDRLTLATDAAGIGIWDLDLIHDRQVWNDQMFQLYGITPAEFRGNFADWETRIHPADQAAVKIAVEQALVGVKEYSTEFRIIRPDGTVRVIAARAIVYRSPEGSPERALGANWDITDYRQALENLNAAKEQAEAANVAKSRFLAIMSHELRTPLNAVLGFASLLSQSEEDSGRREQLDIISSAGTALLGLIQDILDLSRIEVGKVKVVSQDFEVRREARTAVRLFEIQAAKKNLHLAFEVAEGVPERVRGDPGLLRQVLVNLIANAVKFTEQGSIRVLVDHHEPEPTRAMLRFRVIDTGIGIGIENQKRIFEAFEQEDNLLARRYGGTGLGLAIARDIVALMNGQIDVESQRGVGTCFTFTTEVEINHPGHH